MGLRSVMGQTFLTQFLSGRIWVNLLCLRPDPFDPVGFEVENKNPFEHKQQLHSSIMMETTLSSTTNINGGLIKFKNRRCSCDVKAGVKISESQNNPKKLYFLCERGKCKFYSFWESDNEEFNKVKYSESIRERNDGRDNFILQQEMAVVNARLQSL
ncbi:hypothetical protein Ddye_001367 [Dipteronia dyeriana]|uniref:Zinc finger GRF-type domain-containing protein n=1 Tax=Dipteronia dyeriana TaxID=168575 RepID=A0AAD9XP05_9ROSI|nr:hypothetical protein Ddye_001367 [Dipteronia dyeriana]